jgi:hypothetical protein
MLTFCCHDENILEWDEYYAYISKFIYLLSFFSQMVDVDTPDLICGIAQLHRLPAVAAPDGQFLHGALDVQTRRQSDRLI